MRQAKAENLLQAAKGGAGGGGKTSLRCVVLLLLMALRVNNVQTAAYPRCMPTVWQWRGRTRGGVTLIFD